jgi:NADH-quinone oxidoreductase subunit H
MYLYIWYRGTFPRYRFDQLMKVGWKVLLPTGLALLICTGLWAMRAEVWSQVVVPMWGAFVDLVRRVV